MIRFALKDDFESVTELWSLVFGDSADIINRFLDVHFSEDSLLVYEADNRIAAMFFLLKGDVCINSEEYPSRYLYAACTHPDYRGRGIMAGLINAAYNLCAQKSIDYICLLPAEESLYGYYEKFGYKALYGVRKLSEKDFQSSLTDSGFAFTENLDLSTVRDRAFAKINYFKWNKEAVDFAFDFNEYYGGKSIRNRKGYILYNASEDLITVKEIACHGDEQNFLSASLPDIYNGCFLNALVPCGDLQGEKHGMIVPLNEKAEGILPEKMNVYLGLTLD